MGISDNTKITSWKVDLPPEILYRVKGVDGSKSLAPG
jgi:hypothetical protein